MMQLTGVDRVGSSWLKFAQFAVNWYSVCTQVILANLPYAREALKEGVLVSAPLTLRFSRCCYSNQLACDIVQVSSV